MADERFQQGIAHPRDVIRGKTERQKYLDVLISNENALRNACAELPAMLDFCRSFGSEFSESI